jgi:hypothetical protein
VQEGSFLFTEDFARSTFQGRTMQDLGSQFTGNSKPVAAYIADNDMDSYIVFVEPTLREYDTESSFGAGMGGTTITWGLDDDGTYTAAIEYSYTLEAIPDRFTLRLSYGNDPEMVDAPSETQSFSLWAE